ncbi:tyrosine-type recombinase/integrase [Geothrix edaphica]|uniref:Tyr recombinase domain-containing protein n=1 Tax=Geothrix edaphica TaxID=2927976 RepID=A0ABQ5PTK4_9BACT|nr:tyrosine-type recombinase/integrase [Geothrix edaphica]GLH65733.1 hypothetical protein GETHED_00970 [Geothrix edaphica]
MPIQAKKDSGLKDGLRLRRGIYHFRFMYHGKLKTGSTGCRDLRSAKAYLLKLRSALALESIDVRTISKATFQEAFDLYLKVQAPRLAARTVRLFRSNHQHHWSHFQDAPLKDMQMHLDELFPRLAAKMKPGSQRLVFARLRSVLELARKRGLHNTPLEYPTIDVPRDPKQVLSEEQVEVFFIHVDRIGSLHARIMIRSLFYLGLRVSEAQRLHWDDYDEDEMTYRIDERQKNGKILYLPVLPEMAEWFAKQPRKKGELMCPGRWGCHNTRYTDLVVKAASKSMGLEVPMTHHRLRASLSTSLLRRGVPLAVVQRILRHADPATTTKYYWEEGLQDMREGLMVLSKVNGSPLDEDRHVS